MASGSHEATTMVLLVLQVVFGLGIAYTGFCRAVIMRKRSTVPAVRWCMSILTTAGLVFALVPLFRSDWLWLSAVALAGAILLVQVVTSRYWSAGQTPPQFSPDIHAGRRAPLRRDSAARKG